MPAKSDKQRKFFGMVRAIQKGKRVKGADVGKALRTFPRLKKVAKDISSKDAKELATEEHIDPDWTCPVCKERLGDKKAIARQGKHHYHRECLADKVQAESFSHYAAAY